MEEWFTDIYNKCEWGNNNNKLYKGSSGSGSSLSVNETYISNLRDFFKRNNIESVVDIGCGDWQSSYLIYQDMNIKYTGYDCYKDVVNANSILFPGYEFKHLDVFKDREELIDADVYILKDILQHWTCKEIDQFLECLLKKNFKYIIICNCSGQTMDYQDYPLRSRPLSINFYPLKKYPFSKWFTYSTKEVSILEKTNM